MRSLVRHHTSSAGEDGREYLAPLTIVPPVAWRVRPKERYLVREAGDGHGLVVAYVCRGCGLTELYTAGAAELPVGPMYGTDEIDVAADGGPFR